MRDTPLIRHADDVVPVPCPCGQSVRVLTAADEVPSGLHITTLCNAEKHYHRRTTEVYYVLEGEGEVELDEQRYAVVPGHVVYIPPGTCHRAIGHLRCLIVCTPPFDPEDEFAAPAPEPPA
jgi:mannose-6-phosphate isomerase-like protein (cupin superfamily)